MISALDRAGLRLDRMDVVAVASKVVSTCEGRIVRLSQVTATRRAVRLAKRWRINRQVAQLVLDEADEVLGGVGGFMSTVKNGIITANAGVDLKNSPAGTATLWPRDPDATARKLRAYLERRYGVPLGVEIVDSRVTPLRLGTGGLAIGTSGFLPVRDERRALDLYGRRVRFTQLNLADDLAACAHLLMGETRNRTGAVVIRNAPISRSDDDSRALRLSIKKCLIGSCLSKG